MWAPPPLNLDHRVSRQGRERDLRNDADGGPGGEVRQPHGRGAGRHIDHDERRERHEPHDRLAQKPLRPIRRVNRSTA